MAAFKTTVPTKVSGDLLAAAEVNQYKQGINAHADDIDAINAALPTKSAVGHTHTSAAITDFTEAVQDAVAALLGAGSNITLTYNDAANTFTIAASGGGQFDPEATRDAIGAALIGVGAISVVINDALDTITVSTTATVNSTDAQLRDRATHTGSQATSTITGLDTALAARPAASGGVYQRDNLPSIAVTAPLSVTSPGTDSETLTITQAAFNVMADAYFQGKSGYSSSTGVVFTGALTFASVSTNAAPVAGSVALSGTPTVGQTLTGTYTYSDAESNPESGTAKQWFRSDNTSGLNRTAISGATATTYVLVTADTGKYLQYAVTPGASAGTTTGTQVFSAYSAVIAAAVQTLGNPTVSFGTTAATTQVVNWTAVTNATSYTVKRNTTNTQTGATTIYTGALLTFTDTGLTASTAYYYFVIPTATGYTSGLGTGTVTTAAAGATFLTTTDADWTNISSGFTKSSGGLVQTGASNGEALCGNIFIPSGGTGIFRVFFPSTGVSTANFCFGNNNLTQLWQSYASMAKADSQIALVRKNNNNVTVSDGVTMSGQFGLRMRFTGTQVFFERSNDGTTWTNIVGNNGAGDTVIAQPAEALYLKAQCAAGTGFALPAVQYLIGS